MTPPTRETLESLATSSGVPHISIYLPTERAGDRTQQNPIRFKNQLDKARKDLEALGFSGRDIDELLSPAKALVENYEFWQNQQAGLAVLLSQDRFETYRLYDDVPTLTLVSDRFHLKPLIPSTTGQHRYYVLALDEGGVALYRGDRRGVEPITLEGSPDSLSEFLQWDDPETELQWHTETSRLDLMRIDQGTQKRSSMFHGHGAGGVQETKTENLIRFLKALDNAIRAMLSGDSDPPLVLMGGDELIGHYRKVNGYENLMEEAVQQVPNVLKPVEIHELAYPKVAEYFDSDRQQAYQRFHEIEEGMSTVDLETTINAAIEG
ncbi:MAG: hypothetical protein ACLFWD_04020, partial [Anaerolineales bacterium]